MPDSPIVYGYHGTSGDAAARILTAGFLQKHKKYHWLGDGAYFWQDAPRRAWQWASEHHGEDAAVVGAAIELSDCMDMLDVGWFDLMLGVYDRYLEKCKQDGVVPPIQEGPFHRLDAAVINYTVGVLAEEGRHVRSVRCSFGEGNSVFPGSAIYSLNHIQIAVRDLAVIKRTWREDPPGVEGGTGHHIGS